MDDQTDQPSPQETHFEAMQRHYQEHALPWDDPLPPPEVIELAQRMEPGHMLDLGCGPGRACIFLALRGWHCTGVDFVPQAITMAQERAETMGVASRTTFLVASVTHLAMLTGPYDLAIDVGCMHALRGDDLHRYASEVNRLLRPGGSYLLFVRLLPDVSPDPPAPTATSTSDTTSTGAGHRGLAETTIRDLFSPPWVFERVDYGTTHTSESSWESAWFLLHKQM